MPADPDLPPAGERLDLAPPDRPSRPSSFGTSSTDHRERQARLSDARERVNRALTEQFDERTIVTNLLTEAMRALGADSGVVAVLERGSLQPRRATGLAIDAQSAAIDVGELKTPRLWQVLNSDEPSWHDQIDAPDSPLTPLLGDPLGRATLLIPLIHASRPMGAILLTYHDQARGLLSEEVAFARKIGAATSVAIVNARLYRDQRRIATTLQSGFIHPLPAIDGLELGTVSRRAYEPDLIGGDFADVFLLTDRRVLIMSGDVSGHGVRSATLAEGVRSGIRALALAGLSPARILETMNELLILQEHQERFVTVYLAFLEVATGDMTVSCAGHHPPARIGADKVALLRTDQGVPLGSFRRPFVETHVLLDPGEAMVFYTDGIVEARKGDEMFGHQRLLRSLTRLKDRGVTAIAAGVRDAAERFAGELTDDIQVLALRLSRPEGQGRDVVSREAEPAGSHEAEPAGSHDRAVQSADDLERIPGIGPNMAAHLRRLGMRAVADLRGQDPEELYERDCELAGHRIDRCVLYTYRCAVYYASTSRHEPELLKWWNWKDRR